MGNNTPSQSPGDSPGQPTPPPRLPKFEWPEQGQDCPRLDWPSYVKLLAADIDRELGGETGQYLGNWLLALAIQGEQLGATSPIHQEQLATEEQDRAAAYLQALMHEAGHGGWVIIQPDPDDTDATGGWGGHESQPNYDPDGSAQRGFFSRDMDDETYCN